MSAIVDAAISLVPGGSIVVAIKRLGGGLLAWIKALTPLQLAAAAMIAALAWQTIALHRWRATAQLASQRVDIEVSAHRRTIASLVALMGATERQTKAVNALFLAEDKARADTERMLWADRMTYAKTTAPMVTRLRAEPVARSTSLVCVPTSTEEDAWRMLQRR
jgi:hypothetical protein